MKPREHEKLTQSEVEEDLYQETQLWVFQIGERLGDGASEIPDIKPRGISLMARNKPEPDTPDFGFPADQLAWRLEAPCAGLDPKIFFPPRGASPLPAYSVCAQCPVRLTCLGYAVDQGERFGIWGGFTNEERREIRKKMKGGMALEEAMEPIDARRARKLKSALARNSASIQNLPVSVSGIDEIPSDS